MFPPTEPKGLAVDDWFWPKRFDDPDVFVVAPVPNKEGGFPLGCEELGVFADMVFRCSIYGF